jgi:hypothetical protein
LKIKEGGMSQGEVTSRRWKKDSPLELPKIMDCALTLDKWVVMN